VSTGSKPERTPKPPEREPRKKQRRATITLKLTLPDDPQAWDRAAQILAGTLKRSEQKQLAEDLKALAESRHASARNGTK
jgi:uncharacterized membrane-anchored protein YjiN (DUF445 family)